MRLWQAENNSLYSDKRDTRADLVRRIRHLAFWFGVLRDDVDLIEGGQGDAVRHRTEPRLQRHIARVFESACREHAARLVRDGVLPQSMIIGR